MTLSFDKFKKLRDDGLTIDQINRFESGEKPTPQKTEQRGLGFGFGSGVAPVGLGGISSFLGRAGGQVREAGERRKTITEARKKGEQGIFQTAVQHAGGISRLGFDIASELPIIKQGFEMFGKGVGKLSEIEPIKKAGEFISPATGLGLKQYEKLSPAHQRTVGALGEIATTIPFLAPAKTAKIVSKATKPLAKGIGVIGDMTKTGKQIIKNTIKTKLKGYTDDVAEKAVKNNLDELLSQKGLQSQIKLAKEKNINLKEYLSDREIFEGLKVEKGKINPTQAINTIDNRIETILTAKRKMLPEIDKIVPKTPIATIRAEAIKSLKGTPADNLKTIKLIDEQLSVLPKNLSVSQIDKYRALFRQSARNAKGLQKEGSHYSALENATRNTVFDITDNLPISNAKEFANLNVYIKDMIGTKEFVEKGLTGRIVKGGRLTGLFAKGIGAVAGSKFGIFGTLAGMEAGGIISNILVNNQLGNAMKIRLIKNITNDPIILQEVEKLLSNIKNYNPSFLLLEQGAIPLSGKVGESSVKAIPAKYAVPDFLKLPKPSVKLPPREISSAKAITPQKGLVGTDPKTGKFIKTFKSNIDEIPKKKVIKSTTTPKPTGLVEKAKNITLKTTSKGSGTEYFDIRLNNKKIGEVETLKDYFGKDNLHIQFIGIDEISRGKGYSQKIINDIIEKNPQIKTISAEPTNLLAYNALKKSLGKPIEIMDDIRILTEKEFLSKIPKKAKYVKGELDSTSRGFVRWNKPVKQIWEEANKNPLGNLLTK